LTAPLTAAGLQWCRVADLRGMHELAGELAPLDQPAARAHRVNLAEEVEHRRQQQRLRHARRHCDRRRVAAEKEEEVINADAGVACTSDECPVALEPLELLALHRQQQLRRDDLLLREGGLRRRQQVRPGCNCCRVPLRFPHFSIARLQLRKLQGAVLAKLYS
jgi:hypothetical protein